jgi:hypothetical protein
MGNGGEVDLAAGRETFRRIVGARLTSVQFVLNYLIIGFDERGALTTLVWPEFHENGTQVVFGEAPYRNKLCSLIESKVTGTDFTQDETIIIRFGEGFELRIPLQSYGDTGERAIFSAYDGYLRVF